MSLAGGAFKLTRRACLLASRDQQVSFIYLMFTSPLIRLGLVLQLVEVDGGELIARSAIQDALCLRKFCLPLSKRDLVAIRDSKTAGA